ncbi:hypothetical protein [Nevskia sp.]|uniref:hypothetical protein n=1 Tax=Nevskia sp. TaxID=1929292 RepID=UPI0025D16D29|nr:hypothetical protein [Nevskia sp.]
MVRAYSPRVSVVVRKRVERRNGVSTRISGRTRIIDLTPLLGDVGGVQTHKDMHEMSGTFSITIPDQPERGSGGIVDSLYGLIEPMDYVEIRFARSPEEYATANLPDGLPIVMRGFVNSVRRAESLASGTPARTLTIEGHDYGKIVQIANLLPLASYATNQDYQSSFPIFTELGLNPVGLSANKFVGTLVDRVMNPFLLMMREVAIAPGDTGPVQVPLISSDLRVFGAAVAPYGALPPEFRVLDYLDQWCDLDWNELFMDDRAAGPTLVYRPKPYLRLDGQKIQDVETPFALNADNRPLVLADVDVISSRLERSDHDVANFFWVKAPRAFLVESRTLTYNTYSASAGSPPLQDPDPNCDPAIYGLRPLQRETQQASAALIGRNPADETETPRLDFETELNAWMTRRRMTLADLNRDNAVFESGSLSIKGNERIRPGNFFDLTRGDLRARYYAHAVSHSFQPFRSFTTTVQVERGTGFYERTRLQSGPAFAENPRGVYR